MQVILSKLISFFRFSSVQVIFSFFIFFESSLRLIQLLRCTLISLCMSSLESIKVTTVSIPVSAILEKIFIEQCVLRRQSGAQLSEP